MNILNTFSSDLYTGHIEKPESVTDVEYSTMMKSILDAYSEDMGKFEAMKKVYWS